MPPALVIGSFVAGWVAIAAITLSLVLFQRGRIRQRQEAIRGWAAWRGWMYLEQDDSFAVRFAGVPFGTGQRRRAGNVVLGAAGGAPAVCFDYSFVTRSTDGRGRTKTTTHRYTITALRLPAMLPVLQVSQENVLTSLGRALGFHDIEFESEQFNQTFTVQSDSPRFAYDVIHPRMMESLLRSPGPSWRIAGADLLCWQIGPATPERHEAQLGYLDAIRQRIPQFVWNGQPPA